MAKVSSAAARRAEGQCSDAIGSPRRPSALIALNYIEIGWPHLFRTGQIPEKELNLAMVEWLVSQLAIAFPISPTSRAESLKATALLVEVEGLDAGYGQERLKLFAQQLRDAAVRQSTANASWTKVVDRDNLTAQERRILDSLWRHNENEATVWKVPLGTFVNEVWVKSIHSKQLSPARCRT